MSVSELRGEIAFGLDNLRIDIPHGPFSHRDTVKRFEALVAERGIPVGDGILTVLENLMAFRHVATKIYGFLLEWNKLKFVVSDIRGNHSRIKELILDVLGTMPE